MKAASVAYQYLTWCPARKDVVTISLGWSRLQFMIAEGILRSIILESTPPRSKTSDLTLPMTRVWVELRRHGNYTVTLAGPGLAPSSNTKKSWADYVAHTSTGSERWPWTCRYFSAPDQQCSGTPAQRRRAVRQFAANSTPTRGGLHGTFRKNEDRPSAPLRFCSHSGRMTNHQLADKRAS
jgi:hypothetical protein